MQQLQKIQSPRMLVTPKNEREDSSDEGFLGAVFIDIKPNPIQTSLRRPLPQCKLLPRYENKYPTRLSSSSTSLRLLTEDSDEADDEVVDIMAASKKRPLPYLPDDFAFSSAESVSSTQVRLMPRKLVHSKTTRVRQYLDFYIWSILPHSTS